MSTWSLIGSHASISATASSGVTSGPAAIPQAIAPSSRTVVTISRVSTWSTAGISSSVSHSATSSVSSRAIAAFGWTDSDSNRSLRTP